MINPLRRARRTDTDDGFALPFVMLVAFLVMAATATLLGVITSGVVNSGKTRAKQTSTVAAQAGVQYYLAAVNANCTTTGTSATAGVTAYCSYIKTTPSVTNSVGSEKFCVYPVNPSTYLANSGTLRVVSVGLYGGAWKTGGSTPCLTTGGTATSLVADVTGNPSVLRYAYFSDLETLGSDFLQDYYRSRPIDVTSPDVLKALDMDSVSGTWKGLSTSDVGYCESLFYGATGRYAHTTGTDAYTEMTKSVKVNGATASLSRTDTCDATFTNGMNFNGPVYSRDAFLVSNSWVANDTGPTFTVPAMCSTATVDGCETLPPAATPWNGASPAGATSANGPYRPAAVVGGTAATKLNGVISTTNVVQTSQVDMRLPNTTADLDDDTAWQVCPDDTTITLSGTTATMSGGCTGTTTVPNPAIIHVQGNATVKGTLSGSKLSIVADNDIDIAGDLTTTDQTTNHNSYGEPSWNDGSAIDLVAVHDVVVQHAVTCATGAKNSAGYCPNDATGLYTTAQSSDVETAGGQLKAVHPARQYCNAVSGTAGSDVDTDCNTSSPACDTSTSTLTIQAAVFALNGALRTDDFNRGCALGTLRVVGGLYQHHRGTLGVEWPVPNNNDVTARSFSGYKLSIDYRSLQYAGLPYVPPLQAGTAASPWIVLAVATKAST